MEMAPQEGRVVIHGHIREGCVCISGPLADAGHKVVAQVLDYIHARLQAAGQGFHGCVSFRLEIESDGTVGARGETERPRVPDLCRSQRPSANGLRLDRFSRPRPEAHPIRNPRRTDSIHAQGPRADGSDCERINPPVDDTQILPWPFREHLAGGFPARGVFAKILQRLFP